MRRAEHARHPFAVVPLGGECEELPFGQARERELQLDLDPDFREERAQLADECGVRGARGQRTTALWKQRRI